jgi:hypothetical protein
MFVSYPQLLTTEEVTTRDTVGLTTTQSLHYDSRG